jgi:uncharacterized protein (DUF302 family)
MLRRFVFVLCLGWFASAHALETDELFMLRSQQPFPETMAALQEAIKQQGYIVSRVQHVDVGLNAMGFNTDLYRVVFFGKPDEIRQLSQQYPQLIPYLPLQIAIFAETDETLLVSGNPLNFTGFYPDPALAPVFKRWHEDLRKIFHSVQIAD